MVVFGEDRVVLLVEPEFPTLVQILQPVSVGNHGLYDRQRLTAGADTVYGMG